MEFITKNIRGTVSFSEDFKKCLVHGKILESVKNNQISFFAATPPNFRSSYYGSGHAFPNSQVAFENTTTKGIIKLNDMREFTLSFDRPNSYYAQLGSSIIPPMLYISYNNGFTEKKDKIMLNESIPYRSLTYSDERKDCSFYSSLNKLPVRTQEQILRSSRYKYNQKFWDLKPPV